LAELLSRENKSSFFDQVLSPPSYSFHVNLTPLLEYDVVIIPVLKFWGIIELTLIPGVREFEEALKKQFPAPKHFSQFFSLMASLGQRFKKAPFK
jgi:hypothetical protein